MSSGATSRYETIVKLASGGMATVWVGTVKGALGFRQLVAIKKPHPHLLADVAYKNELVTEARLASLIRHANVIDVRDVEVDGESISLVMDYIEGASLGDLVVAASKRGALLSPKVAVRIALDALAGLRAVHELVDERGRHVGLVHRDISPQNIVVGVDGLARVADFGVAKFARRDVSTSEGSLKGKLAYMAPEYLRGEPIDHRFDLFAVGIVLWESLAGRRLFRGANEAETLRLLLDHTPEPISSIVPAAAALDGVLATALARPVEQRFQNALAMATALESAAIAAGLYGGHTEVAATLKELVGPMIEERRALIREKLAHEPSLASLMGVPREVLPAKTLLDSHGPAMTVNDSFVPPTVALGTALQATPRMGGAHDAAPNARTAPLGGGPATIADPPTMIPSTLPMTPRMEGAPVVRTLSSATPPPLATPRGLSGSTLPSAGDGGSQPREGGIADTQLSFNEPSARTANDLSAPSHDARKSRAGAVIAAIGMTLVVGVAVILIVTRGSRGRAAAERAAAEATPASAPESSASSAAGAASAPNALPSGASAPSSARAAGSSSSGTIAAPPAIAGATGTRRGTKGTTPSAGTAPAAGTGTAAPPPAETSKKPPPNPYATE